MNLRETMELLHKGGAVPLNVVEAVNDLLEQVEQQPELWECPGCGFTYDACHEDIDPATGEGNGNHTCPLCELIDVERERDRLRKALRDAIKLMDKKFYGMAHKNLVEALGQEGEGNHGSTGEA